MKINHIRRLLLASFFTLALSAAAEAQEKFEKFTSSEGRFSVEMPGKPTLSTENPKNGTPIQITTVKSFAERFQVAYFELPDKVVRANEPKKIFKLYTSGEYPDQKLDKEKESLLGADQLPALDYRVATEVKTDGGRPIPVFIRERLVLSGNRFYVVQYRAVLNENLLDAKDTNRFFDSFEIPKAPKAEPKKPGVAPGKPPTNASLPPWTKPEADAKQGLGEAARAAERGIMLVGYAKNHGTAWVISRKHRLLITNAHVADILMEVQEAGEKMLAVPSGTSQVYEVEKVYYHPGVRRYARGKVGNKYLSVRSPDPKEGPVDPLCPDLAVLQLSSDGPDLSVELPLASTMELATVFAQPVAMMGFPGHDTSWPGLGQKAGATFHDGVVSRVTDFELQPGASSDELQCLQYTIPNWGGYSGSPVFLPNGHVVAVNNMNRFEKDPKMNAHVISIAHGIRADCVLELLVHHKLADKVPFKIDESKVLVERWINPDRRTRDTRARLAKAIALVDEARVLAQESKDAKGVSEKCTEAMKYSEFFAPAYTYRALAANNYYLDHNDEMSDEEKFKFLKSAIDDMQMACKLEPGDVSNILAVSKIQGNLARLQGDKSFHRQVIAQCEKVLSLETLTWVERAGTHSLRSGARASLGQDEGALADYTAAIRFAPDTANLHEELAAFMENRGIGDRGRANAAIARELRAGTNIRVLRIDAVEAGSIADKAGLKPGYFIVGVDRFRIQTLDGLKAALGYREGPVELQYRTAPTKDTEDLRLTPQKGKIGVTVTSVNLR